MYEIPLTETTLDEEEVEAATAVLRGKWLTMGEEVAAFEAEFAAALGAKHAVAVANGTVALEIVYRAIGLKAGDEIILPSITFIACFNAARLLGAVPVLADVQSESDLTLSPTSVLARLTPRTRAVVSMPHAGYAPDMQVLRQICTDRSIALVEDACHAPLARVDGKPIGTFGDASTWSFFGNKNMTTGEGGMITTDRDDVAATCRLLRSHGITRPTWDRVRGHAFAYDVAVCGTNGRMDEIRAAIGRVQLRKLAGANAARTRCASRLRELIDAQHIPGLMIPFGSPRGTPTPHVFLVLLPDGARREAVMAGMKDRGVQTSIHYPPLYSFTATREFFGERDWATELPVSARIAERILTLPLAPGFSDDVLERVANALAAVLAG